MIETLTLNFNLQTEYFLFLSLLKAVRLFILDEADKLMDKSFVNDVTWIFNQLPVSKQMLSLSATYPEPMLELLMRYMKNPQHIRLGKEDQVLCGIKQFVLKVCLSCKVLRSVRCQAKI